MDIFIYIYIYICSVKSEENIFSLKFLRQSFPLFFLFLGMYVTFQEKIDRISCALHLKQLKTASVFK